jgi:hypothetical protein
VEQKIGDVLDAQTAKQLGAGRTDSLQILDTLLQRHVCHLSFVIGHWSFVDAIVGRPMTSDK